MIVAMPTAVWGFMLFDTGRLSRYVDLGLREVDIRFSQGTKPAKVCACFLVKTKKRQTSIYRTCNVWKDQDNAR
jgi:hypothetical protein